LGRKGREIGKVVVSALSVWLILAPMESFAQEAMSIRYETSGKPIKTLKSQGFLRSEPRFLSAGPEKVGAKPGEGKPDDRLKTKEEGGKKDEKKEDVSNIVGLIFFGFKTYILSDSEKKKLDQINKTRKYKVIGYTDSIGSSEFNNMLAILRANAVSDYLRNNGIVVEESLGRGKCCYVDLEDQSLNRRVEIFDMGLADRAVKKPKKKADYIKFIWLADISVYGTNSELKQGSSIFGGNANMVLAPTVQFGKDKFLITLLNSSYQKKKQVLTESEGPRVSSEYLTYSATPTFKYDYSGHTNISTGIFFTKSLSRESTDEEWYRGLYDYGDIGLSLDLKHLVETSKSSSKYVALNIQRYERVYPNFLSLFSIAGFGSLEEHEKDFTGTTVMGTYMINRAVGWSYSYGLSYVYKDYVDKLLENEIGSRDLEKQRDDSYSFSYSLDYKPDIKFKYGIRTSIAWNKSNQNLVEGSFPFFIFHENYYGSMIYSFGPNMSYTHQIGESRRLIAGFAYNVSMTEFEDRKAKDRDGEEKDEVEVDWTHILNTSVIYMMNDHWSVGAIAEVTAARSNVEDERFSYYNYEIINLSLGFSYHY
jgi:outer membrane protein OmpA-like peptidoglycan-associated protein